jgi:hypothetical protein
MFHSSLKFFFDHFIQYVNKFNIKFFSSLHVHFLIVCIVIIVVVIIFSHWAALFGLVETAQILCEAKADINAPTKTGETPLHLSAEKGKLEMVKYLLQQGAKVDIRDKGNEYL